MIIGWIRLISFNWKWNVTIINLCLVFEMNLMWKPNNKIRNPRGPKKFWAFGWVSWKKSCCIQRLVFTFLVLAPSNFSSFSLTNGVGEGKAGRKGGGATSDHSGKAQSSGEGEGRERPGMSGRSRTVKTQQRAALLFWLENPCFDFL